MERGLPRLGAGLPSPAPEHISWIAEGRIVGQVCSSTYCETAGIWARAQHLKAKGHTEACDGEGAIGRLGPAVLYGSTTPRALSGMKLQYR